MSGYPTASPLCFSVLPVQCLCEFLLTQSVGAVEDSGGSSGRPPAPARHHQLLSHLQRRVRHPSHDQRAYVELVEYFLRRLSSQQRQARLQAAKVRHRSRTGRLRLDRSYTQTLGTGLCSCVSGLSPLGEPL